MTDKVTLWCRCGGSLSVTSTPSDVAMVIGDTFRTVHAGVGHSITDDQIAGPIYVRKARLRARG